MLILHGEDRFRMDEELGRLREALRARHGTDIDTVRFDGAQGARVLPDILDECRSRGLMSPYKIVLVDNADLLVRAEDAPAKGAGGKRAVPAREVLENYAAAPSDVATLVLRAETWRPGNLDKAVTAGGGVVIKFDLVSLDQAATWAQQRAIKHHRTSIDARTTAMLVDAVGADLNRLDTELAKLATAAGGKGEPITAELVDALVGMTRTEDWWDIQSVLLTGDPAAALGKLRELVEVSRHDPVPITFAYVGMARAIHFAARSLADGVPPNRVIGGLYQFGRSMGMLANQIMDLAGRIGPKRAVQLLDAAVRVDAANKSGLGEPVRNLERLTLRLAALGRVGRPALAGSR